VPIAGAAAVLTSVVAFRRQTQAALTPSAFQGPLGRVRVSRWIARFIAGPNPVARATADFVLMTIARNPRQQALIAINAAIAVALIVMGVARQKGDLASLLSARALMFSAPLMLAYWASIGLRATFFAPGELAAAWTFHASGPVRSTAYRAGVCAAMIAAVAPAAALAALLAGALEGWTGAARHAALVTMAVAALAEIVVTTIDFVPFTRPYQPGHAKLRTRWPLYLAGAYAFSYGLVAIERFVWKSASGFVTLLAVLGGVITLLEAAGRRPTRAWSVEPAEEIAGDLRDIAVLDIGCVVHGAHVGG